MLSRAVAHTGKRCGLPRPTKGCRLSRDWATRACSPSVRTNEPRRHTSLDEREVRAPRKTGVSRRRQAREPREWRSAQLTRAPRSKAARTTTTATSRLRSERGEQRKARQDGSRDASAHGGRTEAERRQSDALGDATASSRDLQQIVRVDEVRGAIYVNHGDESCGECVSQKPHDRGAAHGGRSSFSKPESHTQRGPTVAPDAGGQGW